MPALFWYEIRSVLLVTVRRARTSQERIVSKLSDLRTLPIEVGEEPSGETVMRLAADHSLTGYDAAYAALAVGTDRPLATLDKELIVAGQAGAFDLWHPPT